MVVMPSHTFFHRLLDTFRRKPPAVAAFGFDRPVGFAAREMVEHYVPPSPAPIAATPRPPDDDPLADAAPVDLSSPALLEFIDEVKQLPLFSTTAMQLMTSLRRESLPASELARLISSDAGLVAQLLRIVNSPYYGLPQRCATITAAIRVLGIDQICRTVLAAVTQRPLMAYLHDTRVVHLLWRHQLLCAALARHLASEAGLDGEAAFMAGLMHETGRLAILIRHPELTDVLLDAEADDDRAATVYERTHFGFDHAQVAGALLTRWGLPASIVQAIAEHERDRQPEDPFCAAVWRGNRLSHLMMDEPLVIEVASPWMLEIGLSIASRTRILDEIALLDQSPQSSQ
jgi:HD-like signal output (HDOD) protein